MELALKRSSNSHTGSRERTGPKPRFQGKGAHVKETSVGSAADTHRVVNLTELGSRVRGDWHEEMRGEQSLRASAELQRDEEVSCDTSGDALNFFVTIDVK